MKIAILMEADELPNCIYLLIDLFEAFNPFRNIQMLFIKTDFPI